MCWVAKMVSFEARCTQWIICMHEISIAYNLNQLCTPCTQVYTPFPVSLQRKENYYLKLRVIISKFFYKFELETILFKTSLIYGVRVLFIPSVIIRLDTIANTTTIFHSSFHWKQSEFHENKAYQNASSTLLRLMFLCLRYKFTCSTTNRTPESLCTRSILS